MKTTRFLVWSFLLTTWVAHGQDNQPASYAEGWFLSTNSMAVLASGAGPLDYGSNPTLPGNPSAVAEVVTPEIAALARGLENDPKRIFDFVHDHIRYVHYFGSHKGAELTLLERSGNAFDQCALLVALLRAANLTATYQFGTVSFPYASTNQQDYQHWVGATLPNTNWGATLALMGRINGQRGFPFGYYFTGDTNNVIFHHVWVHLSFNGTDYLLDPSFKASMPISGLTNLDAAMSLNTTNLLNAASGTYTPDYVQGVNEAGVRNNLQSCTTTLLSTLQNNYPNYSVEQVVGGQQVVSSAPLALGQPLGFTIQTNSGQWPVSEWQYIPTNLMAVLSVTLPGATNIFYAPALGGDRLSLTLNSNGVAQLWQQDTAVGNAIQTTGSASTVSVTLGIQHPYGSWSFSSTNILQRSNWADQGLARDFQRTNANYILLYAFEAAAPWLTERQQQLDAYRQQGYGDTSRQVVTETLNVLGLNWLLQTETTGELMAGQEAISPHYHHRLGRMAQETGRGYYIDVYAQLDGSTSLSGTNATSLQQLNLVFQGGSYFASALEHGIIEQLQATNLVAASTVKILQLANTNGQRIYLASSTNWSSGANVSGQITNYNVGNLYNQYISQGYNLLLPSNGAVQVAGAGSWSGSGYVALQILPNSQLLGMMIGGGYNGGYVSDPTSIPQPPVVAQINWSQPLYFNVQSSLSPLPIQLGADPVNMADATFRLSTTDLSLGQAEPHGISFSRSYSPSRRNSNPAGMSGGWLHNYYCNAAEVAAPLPGLGKTTPQQMAPTLVAIRALLNLYNSNQPDPRNWLVTALIAKWGVDQLTKNGVSINLGQDTVQFIKQPDGSFTPPANCTMTLSKAASAYSLQQRHGNTFKFDSIGRLTNIVDQYSQSLNVSYLNATRKLPLTATDWKGRKMTFNYTAGQLTSVVDSSNRSVTLGYSTTYSTNGDLTSVTDPQSKTSTFIYDTGHQIVATKDALGQLVVSNVYDSFGRIATQYTQGDTNKTWQIYWSPWQTVEQDPAGSKRRFAYDDKTRLIALQDALSNATQTFYDGQDHVVATISPLNETNQFIYDVNHNLRETIDPLGYSNQLVFDSQNNLTSSVDARGNPSYFGYNIHFQLTGSTNGAGDWFTSTYDSTYGLLSARTDSGGTTSFTYDSWGQLSGISYPGSLGSEGFLNSGLGDVLSHTNARLFVTSFQYNQRRELTNTIAPTNLTTSITMDAVGNVQSATDSRRFTTVNTWSATRKLLATTFPATPQGVPLVTNIYDNRDWLSQTINPLQKPTFFTNDAAGRQISITDPLLRTVNFGFDADGRNTSTTNAAQEITRQQFDVRGEMTQWTDPTAHAVQYLFDGAGNRTFLTNRNQKIWQFQFDKANRLTNTVSPMQRSTKLAFNDRGLLQSVTQPSQRVATFGYDARGRQTSRADQVGTTTYQFDANNNLTNVFENGKTNSWTFDAYDRVAAYRDSDGNLLQYQYDANNNLTNLVYPGNRNVFYFYDSLNRLTNVTDWANRQTSFGYDLANHLTSITRPNGTVRTMNYDAGGEVTNIVEKTTTGFPIAFFTLGWTNSGRAAWEFAAPLPVSTSLPSRSMTFDDDNRIATFNGQLLGYDLDGNLTNGPLNSSSLVAYSFDARNRLTAVGGLSYAYDPAGNRIALTNGTSFAKFVVNPNAKLPQVLVRIQSGVTNYYIYGAGLLYQITETATSTNTLTYHFDLRGSTVALTDGSGNITDQVHYSPYGLTISRSGTNDIPFLCNGRYGVMTDANGLLYMRARYYNAYLCRFINADPAGFSGGLNFYAYADGNPVTSADPFGLQANGANIVIGIAGPSMDGWTDPWKLQTLPEASALASSSSYAANLLTSGSDEAFRQAVNQQAQGVIRGYALIGQMATLGASTEGFLLSANSLSLSLPYVSDIIATPQVYNFVGNQALPVGAKGLALEGLSFVANGYAVATTGGGMVEDLTGTPSGALVDTGIAFVTRPSYGGQAATLGLTTRFASWLYDQTSHSAVGSLQSPATSAVK